MKFDKDDKLLNSLRLIIKLAVRVLAVLMTLVILWGVADVVWILYKRLMAEPKFLLDLNDLIATFGAFLAVLVAIEIFLNVVIYLKKETIHIKIVLATALIAVARKAIIFDYEKIGFEYVVATGIVILSLSIAYWLLAIKGNIEPDDF